MVFEDIDVGDEARRNGDYVGFPHSNADGTALDSASPQPGVPVTLDGNGDIELVGTTSGTPAADTVVGILSNYDVYGDFENQKISDNDANIKFRGEVKADLTAYGGGTVGEYVDDNGDVFVSEAVDAGNNIYVVQVR